MSSINTQEIEIAMKRYGDVVLTKDIENNVIVMSMDEYKKKNMKKDIIKKLKQSEEEIEKGEGIELNEALKDLRHNFGY